MPAHPETAFGANSVAHKSESHSVPSSIQGSQKVLFMRFSLSHSEKLLMEEVAVEVSLEEVKEMVVVLPERLEKLLVVV